MLSRCPSVVGSFAAALGLQKGKSGPARGETKGRLERPERPPKGAAAAAGLPRQLGRPTAPSGRCGKAPGGRGNFFPSDLRPRLWLCAGRRNYSARSRLTDCCLRDRLVHRLTTVGSGHEPMLLGSADQRQDFRRSKHAPAQRVNSPTKPAKSASRHCRSGRLVLAPGTATAATRGCSRPPGRWLTGRHCCGAGAVGYWPTRGRSVAGWPCPATSVAAAGGSRPR